MACESTLGAESRTLYTSKLDSTGRDERFDCWSVVENLVSCLCSSANCPGTPGTVPDLSLCLLSCPRNAGEKLLLATATGSTG